MPAVRLLYEVKSAKSIMLMLPIRCDSLTDGKVRMRKEDLSHFCDHVVSFFRQTVVN